MNKKSLLVVLILCGLILSALIARNGKLLLLAMPFLVYLMVGALQAPSEIRLVANRTIGKPSITAQEAVDTRIVIKNQGNALVNLYLDDALFPSMTVVEGRAQQRLGLPGGDFTELSYVFKAGRGVYSWSTVRACASDPLGLFDLECEIPAFGEVLVYPEPMRIRSINLRPRFTLHTAGPIPARLAGSGTDFWGIREYRAGDSLRRLNWRLAARHTRKLYTNEYEQEEIADFGLILDARKLARTNDMEEALFEYSVRAAASLSENFLKQGNRVSLLIFGESITAVFPGYGKNQLNSMRRNLARARLGANLHFKHLEYLPARLFPTRSQIVIFSTVDARDLATYARLLAFGYDVLLISPDPVDYASGVLPLTGVNALAVRAARVERVAQLNHLLRLGVNVIDWQVSQPLDTVVRKVESHNIHRRTG